MYIYIHVLGPVLKPENHQLQAIGRVHLQESHGKPLHWSPRRLLIGATTGRGLCEGIGRLDVCEEWRVESGGSVAGKC